MIQSVSGLECPRYNNKQSDSKAAVMQKLLGIWSPPSLPWIPGPLWSGVVAPDKVLSMSPIELFDI